MPNDQDNSQYADTGWNGDDASAGGGTSSNSWGKKASKGLGAVAGALSGSQSGGNRYQGAQTGSPNPPANNVGSQIGGLVGLMGNAYNRYQGAQTINNSAQAPMGPMQPGGGQVPFSAPPVNNMLPPSAPQPMAVGGTVTGMQGNGENNIPSQPYNAPKPYGGPLGPIETQPPIPAIPMANGGMVGGPTDSLTGAPTGAFGGMASAGAQYNGPGAASTPQPAAQPQQPAFQQQSQGGGVQQGGSPQQGGWQPQGMGGGQAGPWGQFNQGGGQNRWGGGPQMSGGQAGGPPMGAPAPMQSGQNNMIARPPMGGGQQFEQRPMRYQPGPQQGMQDQSQQMAGATGGPIAPPQGQQIAPMARGGVIDGGIPGLEPPKAEAAMRRYSPIGPRNPAAMFSPSPTDEAHRLPNRMSLTPKINVKMPHPKKFGTGPTGKKG